MSWKNHNLDFIKECPYMTPPRVIIPVKIVELLERLEKEFDTELSFYMSHRMIGEKHILLDEIYIPKQKVSYSDVKVTDKVPEKYNVHIHVHPRDVNDFSSTDLEYSSANNTVALLWVRGSGFTTGTYKKKLPCGYYAMLRIPIQNIMHCIDCMKDTSIEEMIAEFKEKVEKETFSYYGYYGYRKNYLLEREPLEVGEKEEERRRKWDWLI